MEEVQVQHEEVLRDVDASSSLVSNHNFTIAALSHPAPTGPSTNPLGSSGSCSINLGAKSSMQDMQFATTPFPPCAREPAEEFAALAEVGRDEDAIVGLMPCEVAAPAQRLVGLAAALFRHAHGEDFQVGEQHRGV